MSIYYDDDDGEAPGAPSSSLGPRSPRPWPREDVERLLPLSLIFITYEASYLYKPHISL